MTICELNFGHKLAMQKKTEANLPAYTAVVFKAGSKGHNPRPVNFFSSSSFPF